MDMIPVVPLGEVTEDDERAVVTIEYRGMSWRVTGVPFDAELTAERVAADSLDAQDSPVGPVRREMTLRLTRVEYEARGGAPEMIP